MRWLAAAVWVLAASVAEAREAPAPPPGSPPAIQAIVTTRPLSEAERLGATALEHNPNFGVSGARGSAAVGVLLGPIGVMGNIAHIRSANRERGGQLVSLTETDLHALLATIIAGSEPAPEAQPVYELAPFVMAAFDTPTDFTLTCAIHASLPGERRRGWRGRYLVWPEGGAYDATSPDSLAAAQAAIEPCLREAHRIFTLHTEGAAIGAPQRFQSGIHIITQPLLPGELAEGRFVANDAFGLASYRRAPTQLLPDGQ